MTMMFDVFLYAPEGKKLTGSVSARNDGVIDRATAPGSRRTHRCRTASQVPARAHGPSLSRRAAISWSGVRGGLSGATSGIGEAIARSLAAAGTTVLMVGRSDQRLGDTRTGPRRRSRGRALRLSGNRSS
ncbi:hypothetical protein ABZ801_38440 [Actinomadura sp. NPDC047616]|uniref:hypothetical protein n=1 Tax=Actinomadura sp. NPDC047616 TaxID=3155914 RepID=UPI0033E83091